MARLPKGGVDPKALAQYTRDLWRATDPMYAWWTEHRWRRVIDYLSDNHWRVLDAVGHDLDDHRIPKWKRFPIIGLTLGVYSDQLGQWLQSMVRFSASSASADPSNIAKAEMAEGILKYLWDLTELESHRIDLGAWLLSTGMASLDVIWDTDTGNLVPLAIPETEDQQDEEGNTVKVPTGGMIPVNPETLKPDPSMDEPVLVDAGEIAVDVISPQFARYGRKRREGVMVGSRVSYDEAEAKYGKKIADNLSYARTVSSVLDLSWVHGGADTTQDERALVIRHMLPRSSRHPNGLWWSATEHGVIVQDPAPLAAKRVSTIPFRWIPLPGYWAFGVSPLHAVSHSNKGAEIAKQKQQEWMERVLPKVLLMAGGGVPAGAFDESPGQEITGVNPGAEPAFLDPPAYPQQMDQQRKDSIEEGMLAAGYNFRRPPDVLPGQPTRGTRQPPQLKEGSEVKLALLTTKTSWQEVAKVLLGYVGRFYTEERVVAVGGPDRAYQWIEFKGTDFANLAASIHVDEIPYYPWNRQTMRETVISLLATPAGQVFFETPDGKLDRDKLQTASEAVGVDVALSTLDVDVLEARNEISSIRAGTPVEYQDFQDSEIHLTEKLKTVKGLAFRGWKKEAQQMLLQNIGEHRQALGQQQQEAEKALTDQERELRTIRADTEAMGETKKMLAQVLLDLVKEMLMPPESTQGD